MSNWRNSSRIRLGIALLLLGQFLSIAHAIEFGPAPHQHHGVDCVAIVHDDDYACTVATSSSNTTPTGFVDVAVAIRSAIHSEPLWTVRPPQTGPPSI